MNRPVNSRPVYSTDAGRLCPACGLAMVACACKAQAAAARRSGAGPVRVSRQSKGRGGKTVTLVQGLPLDDAALAALGKQLRQACGSGGTHKDGLLEIQGDHVDQVLALLAQQGFAAKRSGG